MTTNGAVDQRHALDEPASELESLPEPDLSPAAQVVFERRFLDRDDSGALETPRERLWSVATAAARGSADYEGQEAQTRRRREYYHLMARGEFLPAAPTLANLGRAVELPAASARVLSAPGSLDAAFDLARQAALIQRAGGRVTVDLGRATIGPTGTGQRPDRGPADLLSLLGTLVRAVGPDPGGAILTSLRVDHPEILAYLDCTRELSERNQVAFETAAPYLGAEQRAALKQALLDTQRPAVGRAVGVTDRFMVALVRGEEYELRDPRSGTPVGSLPARDVFARLVEGAWADADPNVVFVDRAKPGPAGRRPLEAPDTSGDAVHPDAASADGFLNLAAFCRPLAPRNGHPGGSNGLNGNGACHAGFTRHPALDWERLGKATRLAVRFLDDLVSVGPYPDAATEAAALAARRLGLGVMGWADLLLMLGLPYDGQAALELADEVMGFIAETARDESANLAEQRGACDGSDGGSPKQAPKRRNAAIIGVSSTGPISLIAGCTAGIEPLAGLTVEQREAGGTRREAHPLLLDTARREGFWTEDLAERIVRAGSIRALDEAPERCRAIFVTAADISPEWHVRMQAAFQRHADGAVAKTIRLPVEAAVEDVERIFRLAYELGCHGLSVYRQGSGGPRPADGAPGAADAPLPARQPEQLRARPRLLQGLTYQQETPLGTAYVTVNLDEWGEPFEVFVNQGKTGSDVAAMSVAIGKLASLALRLPSPMSATHRLREVARRLHGIGGGSAWGNGPDRARSLPDALARVLETYLDHQRPSPLAHPDATAPEAVPAAQLALPLAATGEFCPDCSNGLVFEEGASKCLACGLVR